MVHFKFVNANFLTVRWTEHDELKQNIVIIMSKKEVYSKKNIFASKLKRHQEQNIHSIVCKIKVHNKNWGTYLINLS